VNVFLIKKISNCCSNSFPAASQSFPLLFCETLVVNILHFRVSLPVRLTNLHLISQLYKLCYIFIDNDTLSSLSSLSDLLYHRNCHSCDLRIKISTQNTKYFLIACYIPINFPLPSEHNIFTAAQHCYYRTFYGFVCFINHFRRFGKTQYCDTAVQLRKQQGPHIVIQFGSSYIY
jgi:hypothetical protein